MTTTEPAKSGCSRRAPAVLRFCNQVRVGAFDQARMIQHEYGLKGGALFLDNKDIEMTLQRHNVAEAQISEFLAPKKTGFTFKVASGSFAELAL